ncbi:hypothetical protein [Streptomyces sp. NBC_01320]|uniref:hypothetical protein n=1 Tax=Streptomyces sp. NBC_01320 TaxID=2903824 RepID=UPI002E0F8950|nr:hypothetical protein OG395_03280 [Streptomyces sp. NBC_01320]
MTDQTPADEPAADQPGDEHAARSRVTARAVARLKAENNTLRDRLARQSATIEELTSFKTLALSRIAAQHEEITRVRSSQPDPDTPPVARLTPVPGRSQTIGSCS